MSKKRINCRTIDSFFVTPSKRNTFSISQPIHIEEYHPQEGEDVVNEEGDNGKSIFSCPTSIATVQSTIVPEYECASSCERVQDGSSIISLQKESASSTSFGLTDQQMPVNDIGLHVGSVVDDFTKRVLLENHWEPPPPPGYKLPFSEQQCRDKDGEVRTVKRYLSKKHIDSFHWLVYSPSKKGLYCKYCALFSHHRTAGHNKGVALGMLVTEPLRNFKKLKGKDGALENHDRHQYHNESVLEGKAFLKAYRSPRKHVANQLSAQRLQQVQENRQRLRPIIESIIFLGRQNIPLRGHRDDGSMIDEGSSEANEGNFRELLRFRVASGDKELERHLQSASSRATYISKTTQNELIKCCGEEICESVVSKIKEARFFSVLFDGTTDISNIEQLSLSFRYVHRGSIREDFMKFVDAYEFVVLKRMDTKNISESSEPKLTGQALGQIVIDLIKGLNLDINNCVGIGTDNCSVMSSEAVGAVKHIMLAAPNACRCPCNNHALNNSISKSSNIPSIRNAVSVVKSVVAFFNASAKRGVIFNQVSSGSKLSSLCETRWVERHDSLIRFQDLLLPVLETLTSISEWKDLQSSSAANSLINSLCSSEFIIALLSVINLLKETLPLSRFLQSSNLDVSKASDTFNRTINVLEEKRKNADTRFAQVYYEATQLASEMGFDLQIPRLARRQIHRENYCADSVVEYYRKSLYIPLLDNVVQDLKDRLPQTTMLCLELRIFMPTVLLKALEKKVILN